MSTPTTSALEASAHRGQTVRPIREGNGARVCLVTTGQPSTNPRLTKEADALADAGYQVHVVGAHWADWADRSDADILRRARWSIELIDWRRDRAPVLFHWSRVRHWAARRLTRTPVGAAVPCEAALSRVGPELRRAAMSVPAELYIAHNLGALPAAHAAARLHGARLGFDAEDFHSGQIASSDPLFQLTHDTERALIAACTYVTAASPGIADAYVRLAGVSRPTCILNVFPLHDRPAAFRPTDPGQLARLYWFSQTIGPGRGLEDAVKALTLLPSHTPQLHLRGQWQAGYERELRAHAERCGLRQDRIVSHAPENADEMVRSASAYEIGLALEPGHTSNNSLAVSNKVFTYILAGAAVIATRTVGQSAILPQLGPGAVGCTPGDAVSLAAALAPWLEDRHMLETARRHAWDLGGTVYNWDREKHTFLDVVGAALKKARHFDAPAGSSGTQVA